MIDLLQHVGSVRSVGARLFVAAKAVACAAVVLLATQFSFAADRLTLKDGQVLEGTVTRELDGVIWFKYKLAGVEQIKMFTSTEFTKLERDAGAATDTKGETPASDKATTPVVPSNADTKPTTAKRSGVPRAAVVTLGETRDDKQGDMVGIYMTAYALQQMRPMLEEEVGNDGTGIVVLRINSGGGALLEIKKLSDEIHEVYKKKFRTVGWIDSAISAAAMTGIALEEIYFTHRGNFGACTGYRGRLDAMKGIELERVLILMEQISARGGYHPLIMRAMQISVPLSATRGADGKMQFFPDETSGEFIVNRKGEILTLNPESARKIDFSRGTASTLDELTKAMGYQELDWVGEDVPGSLYPISKAEKWNIAYRVKAKTDEDRTQEYFTNYTLNVNAAASEQTREGRGRFVGRARVALDKIREMVRNNPNFMIFALNIEDEAEYKEWLAREEKRLRDLMR